MLVNRETPHRSRAAGAWVISPALQRGDLAPNMRIEPRRGGATEQSSSCLAQQTGARILALSNTPAPTRIPYAAAPGWAVAPRGPNQPLKSFLLWRCRRENLTPRGFWFRLRLRGLLRFFLTFIFVSHRRKHDTDARPRKVPQRIPRVPSTSRAPSMLRSHRCPVPHPSGVFCRKGGKPRTPTPLLQLSTNTGCPTSRF